MRIRRLPEHPLRIYIEEEIYGEIQLLLNSVNSKYAPPDNPYNNDQNEELSSIIFHDDELDKYYIVHGLLNILMRESNALGILCNNEIPENEVTLLYPEIDKEMLEGIILRDYQTEGISSAIAYKRGIIQVHTGGGKTEMMIGVSRYLFDTTSMHIIICVPTTHLLYQTYERMKQRGIDECDISLLGDGNSIDPKRRILISTVQSAYQRLGKDEVYEEWLKKADCLMMDEAHHSKCRTWSTLIDRVAPSYLLGFSAEPFHRNKEHIIGDLVLRGLLGPVIHRVTIEYLVNHGYLSKPYVIAMDSKYKGNMYSIIDWATVNKNCIVKNVLRNQLIRDVSQILIENKKNPLILVQQIAHGKEIAECISKLGYNVVMMTGGRSTTVFLNGEIIDTYKDTDNVIIKDFNEGKIDVLIGTSTLDEGIDIPALSAVILAGGGKSSLKTLQRIGRGLRPKSGDNTTVIIDFRDMFNVVTNSHFKKRKILYDELGMPVYYVTDIQNVPQIIHDFSSMKEG